MTGDMFAILHTKSGQLPGSKDFQVAKHNNCLLKGEEEGIDDKVENWAWLNTFRIKRTHHFFFFSLYSSSIWPLHANFRHAYL